MTELAAARQARDLSGGTPQHPSPGKLGDRQQPIDLLARRRPGEQIALHLVAAGEPQQDALLLGLDALDQHASGRARGRARRSPG